MRLGPGNPCPACGWRTTPKPCREKARRTWSRHFQHEHNIPQPTAAAIAEQLIPRRTR
jgi:hypothetical protein